MWALTGPTTKGVFQPQGGVEGTPTPDTTYPFVVFQLPQGWTRFELLLNTQKRRLKCVSAASLTHGHRELTDSQDGHRKGTGQRLLPPAGYERCPVHSPTLSPRALLDTSRHRNLGPLVYAKRMK